MAGGGIKIKLAVDKARNRVLFADAGSDFVDVLLSFLTLPLSAVRLVAGPSSPGCLSTLCQGVSCLRESKLLRPDRDACHDMLLRPRHEDEFGYIRCSSHRKFACSSCLAIVTSESSPQGRGFHCRCWQVMARVAYLFIRKDEEKFVKANQRFVISDDLLMIKVASTANTLLLLQRKDSGTINHRFEEIEVCIGWSEVVSMLKAFFSSKTVFTDTFLSKKTEVPMTVNLGIIAPNIQHQSDEETDASPQFSIKVFYDRREKKVIYAECKHEFVDLLLSFLVYPVACVTKNLAGTSHLGWSLDNLYGSVTDLDANSALGVAGAYYNREMLLDPSMTPFCASNSGSGVTRWFGLCRIGFCGPTHGNCNCSQFVKDATYIVDDDLLIYQASAVVVTKHWCNRGTDRLLEMDIEISKQEAVDLLRAALTSKTALTDVFKSKLEDKCKLYHFQIFVKLHTGETIALDVEKDDTIATVKHKINEKAGLQLPAGYPYQLVYGNRLRDWSTIAECNIGKGSTVHLAV